MLYLGKKQLNEKSIEVIYSLIDAEDIVKDIVYSTISYMINIKNMYIRKKQDEELEDVTSELIDSDFNSYNILPSDYDYNQYIIVGEIKWYKGQELVISIYNDEEGVSLAIDGDPRILKDNKEVPPFFDIVDTIENNAYYVAGYIEGKNEQDESDNQEKQNEFDAVEREIVPSKLITQRANEYLKECCAEKRKAGEIVLSNPLISMNGSEIIIAVVFTEYTKQDALEGLFGRPTGIIMFDIKGYPFAVEYEEHLEAINDIKKIKGDRFSIDYKNKDEMDVSDDYYEEAYDLLDEFRSDIIERSCFNEELLDEYMNRIMRNIPEDYRQFYLAVSIHKNNSSEYNAIPADSNKNLLDDEKQIIESIDTESRIAETTDDKANIVNDEKKKISIELDDELKIGKAVKKALMEVVDNELLDESTVKDLQDKEISRELFHISYPLLKKVDMDKPIKEQIKINGYNRYWVDVFMIDGDEFFVCSQWHENHRTIIKEWIESL